jgi:cytochrome b6-f complex iron-sulfur subunit
LQHKKLGNTPCLHTVTVARRTILQGGVAGAVALSLPACGPNKPSAATGPVTAGNLSSMPVGSLQAVGDNLFLGRDANGLYAMTAICTHAGCQVSDTSPTQLDCPCHGSRFDGNGNVVRGPAFLPLQHFQVDLASDGSITIQASTPVASTVRTATG